MSIIWMIGRVSLHKIIYILHKALLITHFICIIIEDCHPTPISENVNNALVVNNTLDVWNHRLVHPSNDVLQHMSPYFPYIKYNNIFICHAFHLAKQSKFHFPTSFSTTSNGFELVHMDIWGL